MSKYIDAEKLIAEVKRRIDSWSIRGENSPVGQGKDTCVSRVTELTDLLSFIDSLQQEQPSLPSNLDEAAEEYAKEQLGYCDDDPDDENLCWQPLYFAFKAGAELERQMKQEQPEVDLEEKIKDYFQGYWPGTETAEQCNTDMHFTPPAIMRLVKYAYELGKNARKEE